MEWMPRGRISDVEWNDWVGASGSAAYMNSAYLDAVAPGWGALHWPDGLVFPMWPRWWGPIRQYRQPWFVQHLSLMSSGTCEGISVPQLAQRLSDALNGPIAGARLLEFQVDEGLPDAGQIPPGWKVWARTTYRLSLNKQDLRAGYSTHHRRHIRPVDGLTFTKSLETGAFLNMLKQQMAQKAALTASQFWALERLLPGLLSGQQGELWTLYQGDSLMCGCLLLRSGPRLIYQLAASSPASMNIGGMHRLIDHLLHHPEFKGLEFDFEGSDLPGLQRFYSGFGATPHTYTRWVRDDRHPLLKRIQKI